MFKQRTEDGSEFTSDLSELIIARHPTSLSDQINAVCDVLQAVIDALPESARAACIARVAEQLA
jgi:hypothetical protein